MSQASPLLSLLRRVGLSPQKTLLCIFDLTALLGTALLVFGLRATYGGLDPILYKWVLPLLLLGPVLGSSFGIYQSISLPPQRELKALFLLTCLTYSLILAVLFLAQAGDAYSRLVIAGSWAATVFTLPIMRGLCRRLFAKNRWWGRPLIILDRSDTGRDLWRYLKRHPDRGLTPVGIFALPEDLPGLRRLLATAAKRHPGAMILIHHKMGLAQPVDYITETNAFFSDILVVPAFDDDFKVRWLTPRDLGNVVGLLVRRTCTTSGACA